MDDPDSQNLQSSAAGNATKQNPELIDEEDPSRLIRTEVRKGSMLGTERVRIVLPAKKAFRRVGTGMLEATEVTQVPRKGVGRVVSNVKRVLIGAPLASAQAEHERYTKFKALAVLSSDAISSVAYATEAIFLPGGRRVKSPGSNFTHQFCYRRLACYCSNFL